MHSFIHSLSQFANQKTSLNPILYQFSIWCHGKYRDGQVSVLRNSIFLFQSLLLLLHLSILVPTIPSQASLISTVTSEISGSFPSIRCIRQETELKEPMVYPSGFSFILPPLFYPHSRHPFSGLSQL